MAIQQGARRLLRKAAISDGGLEMEKAKQKKKKFQMRKNKTLRMQWMHVLLQQLKKLLLKN